MQRTMLGILTPSSNTVLEPISSAIVADLDNVSAHFGRFEVTEISFEPSSQAQFNPENQLAAARLLAHANVDSIVWSGTAASWLGFDQDEQLCQRIEQETGVRAGSSVLAINEQFAYRNVKRFALVSPYIDSIQEQIIRNYANHGFECVAERHLGEHRNFDFSEFSEQTIAELVQEVATAQPDAIALMCTNMRGARSAQWLEEKTKIPVIDSTAAAVWAGLRIAGADPTLVRGWGSMFEVR